MQRFRPHGVLAGLRPLAQRAHQRRSSWAASAARLVKPGTRCVIPLARPEHRGAQHRAHAGAARAALDPVLREPHLRTRTPCSKARPGRPSRGTAPGVQGGAERGSLASCPAGAGGPGPRLGRACAGETFAKPARSERACCGLARQRTYPTNAPPRRRTTADLTACQRERPRRRIRPRPAGGAVTRRSGFSPGFALLARPAAHFALSFTGMGLYTRPRGVKRRGPRETDRRPCFTATDM
jgi:hypothetical protein